MRRFEFTVPTHFNHSGKTAGTLAGRFWKTLVPTLLLLLASRGGGVFAQCALVCNNNVNVSLPGPNANCALEVTVDMVLENPNDCANPLTVTILDLQGQPLIHSPWVNASQIGQTLIFSVKETGSGNSCWGTLKVEDKLGPQITGCGDISLPCIVNYKPTTDGGNVPAPTFADCSQIQSISYSDIIDNGSCATPYSGLVNRTWTAVDKWGNTSTCSQFINLERISLSQYTPVCPENVNLQCGVTPPNTSPAATGYPRVYVGGVWYNIVPGANNFCELAASYSDEVFGICGGGKKILRTWTVYDWCLPTTQGSGNPFSCIQVIKIEDTVPPVVTCPAPIVQGSASNGCSASLNLPAATVTDACSNYSVKVITPFGTVNGNGGLLLNVPVGVHQITYLATDDCGNIGSCVVSLTIKDTTPPIAVCDEHTTVSLTIDGTAVVSAVVFDDGSTDNCAIDRFEVRRMPSLCNPVGTPFEAYTTFNCCDVGENLMVQMRVWDKSGNYNDCMVAVVVQDKIDPTIICPPDKTIECSDPVPAVTPPTVNDNCPGVTWTHTELNNITNCGVGTILRTYTATDASGRKVSCTQKITVKNSLPFNLGNIVWPWDYTTNQCNINTDPANLPPGYNVPTIYEDICDLVAVAHTDQLLPTNPPACFKILRKWIVIDWCQYNPNLPGSPGYWEHVQVIKVQDTTPPVITCPNDTTVISLDNNCATGNVVLPSIQATDCSQSLNYITTFDYYDDKVIDVVGSSTNQSGSYPFGTHKVTVKVEDYCGNSSTCSYKVTVKDGKKPTPVCINGLAVELMADPPPGGNGGMVALTPKMFDKGSFDNCTPKDSLVFNLSPSLFTCTNVGTNFVTLWVTDKAGNSDYCETYVIIQDNMVVCPPGGDSLTADVSGKLADESGSGLSGAVVNVSGNGPLTAPVTTNANGHFQFFDLNLGYDYTFTPGNNLNPLNGVTTYDLVLITRHILNVQALDSPYKIIAADVNKSGSVTTLDVVELRKLILQIIPTFTNNTSWRFVKKSYVFPTPANPFQPPFPEFYNINNLSTNLNGIDFVAIKTGDVNGSAVTNLLAPPTVDDRQSGESLTFVVDDLAVEAGKLFTAAFKAKDFINILGYQFALHFDPNALELMDIQPGDLTNLSDVNFGLTMLDQGIITTSWDNSKNTLHDDNTVLFSFQFKAKTNVASLSDLLQISTTSMKAEAYRLGNNEGIEPMNVFLRFNNPTLASADFELYQNNPNPFRKETAIGFRLPENSQATLTVYDLSGKALKVVSGNFTKGYNEILLNDQELGSSGILFYQLETPSHTATRRMVRL